MLKNLIKVRLKWKNPNITCYKLTSLVYLWQGNVKESRKSSYLLNDLSNFNEIFRKDVIYNNIKSQVTKKQGFTLSSEHTFLEKPHYCPPPPPPPSPSLFRVDDIWPKQIYHSFLLRRKSNGKEWLNSPYLLNERLRNNSFNRRIGYQIYKIRQRTSYNETKASKFELKHITVCFIKISGLWFYIKSLTCVFSH